MDQKKDARCTCLQKSGSSICTAVSLVFLIFGLDFSLEKGKSEEQIKIRHTVFFISILELHSLVFYVTMLLFTRCFCHLRIPKDIAHSATSTLTCLMIQKPRRLKWLKRAFWF